MTQTGELDLCRWVEASHLEYGGDPWCFIRELAQNSRDADATRIDVSCGSLDSDQEWISFCDNGRGMDLSNARDFLLKLYASSKDETEGHAGTFGVGFWTVLLFRPSLILISSRTDDETWGLKIDHRLNVSRQESAQEHRGTSITLIRERAAANAAVLYRETIMERVSHYCRFLSCRLSNNSLATFCEGKRINSELTLGLGHEFHFQSKHMRGVVALAHEPRVELLVKGIPVWTGCSLNELSQVNNSIPEESFNAGDFDLAPAYLLDAKRLKVSLTRRDVIHDQELNAIISEAKKAFSLYLKKQAELAFPPSWVQIIRHWLSLHRTRALLLLLTFILSIPFILYALSQMTHSVASKTHIAHLQALHPSIYQGALHSELPAVTQLPYQIRYSPSKPLLLRWFTASEYDMHQGWIYTATQAPQLFEELKEPIDTPQFTISIWNFSSKTVPLLIPALTERFRLVSASPHPLLPLPEIKDNLITLRIPDGLEKVIYQTYTDPTRLLDETERSFWLSGPALDDWPMSWLRMISQGRNATVMDRLHLIERLMKANFHYLTSPSPDSSLYSSSSPWLNQVLDSGIGDCDVINGFAVLLLRSLDIPARLVIGWQGRDGTLESDLHAWCEAYVHDEWMILDYSPLVSQWAGSQESDRFISPLPPFIIPLLLVIFFLIILVLVIKSRFINSPGIQFRPAANTDSPDEIRSRLIQSARSAVLRPRIWGSENAVWDLPLLPSFPEPISLREAVAAFNRGRLISVSDPDVPPSSLTGSLTKNRFIRFNSSASDEICRLLPQNLDLSELPWHTVNLPQSEVIEELNSLLKNDPHGSWKIVEMDQLIRSDPMRWFNLKAIHGSKKAYGSDLIVLIARNAHPPFSDALSAWEWICAQQGCLNINTIRRVTKKLLRKAL